MSITLNTDSLYRSESLTMTPKKLSIVVPCYNVEKYLPRCLDSLIAQTLEDIEIICINDGSPDNCLAILRDYEQAHPEKIVVIDKENEGVWRGRFDAIACARGEYIGFVDSDDFVEETFCQKLYDCAIENDADIAVCGFKRIDATTGKTLNTEMIEPRPPINVAREPQRLLELNGAPWNKIFRAPLLKKLHDFEEPPRIFDDMIMHLLTYPWVKKIAFTPYALVNYLIRDDSIMTTIDKTKIDSAYEAMLEVKEVYAESASTQLRYFLDAAAFLHLGVSLMFRVSYDRTADLARVLKENHSYLNKHFPTWKSGNIISAQNARTYKGALEKAYLARIVYKAGLMRPALAGYRFMITHFDKDIKW